MQVTRDGQHGRNASGGSYWQWLDKAHLALQVPGAQERNLAPKDAKGLLYNIVYDTIIWYE